MHPVPAFRRPMPARRFAVLLATAAMLVAGAAAVAGAQDAGAQSADPADAGDRPALKLETLATINVDHASVGLADRGDIVAYVYAVTNSGRAPVDEVSIDPRHGGAGRLSAVASETLIIDAPPYRDSSDATPNDGKWSRLAPGDMVVFTATYEVVQADIDRQ